MLTLDEIEDSFEVAFLHAVEDLPDAQIALMLGNVRELRRLAPPSLAVSRAREILTDIQTRRNPPAPEPEPEPVVEAEAEPEVETLVLEDADVVEEPPVVEEPVIEADAAEPTPSQPWSHPSVTLELTASPLRRMMHWFFG